MTEDKISGERSRKRRSAKHLEFLLSLLEGRRSFFQRRVCIASRIGFWNATLFPEWTPRLRQTVHELCTNPMFSFHSGYFWAKSRFPDLLETLVVRSDGRSCWSRVSCAQGRGLPLSLGIRVHPKGLRTTCVQEGGFEGPENGPKQRRINNRLLGYRPDIAGGTVQKYLIVRRFSVFRNCPESPLRYKTATSPIHLLCTISKSQFRPSWNVQPTQRQDVLANLESAMFWPSSKQQTEPECESLEDKLLRRTSPTVRELSLKRP